MLQSFFLILPVLITIILPSTYSSNMTCSDEFKSCNNQHLICKDDQPCSVSCTGTNQTECFNSTITCAPNQPCSLYCYDYHACGYMIFDASQSSELTIKAKLSYTIVHSTILCPIGGNCTISCGDRSCTNSYINAYKSNYVKISDGSQLSYQKSTINATNAQFLYIAAATYYGFRKSNIYCPDNGPKLLNGLGYSCKIDASIYNWWSMSMSNIYAIEGMNDVELIGKGFYWEDPILHCDEHYNTSCELGYSSSTVYCDSSELDGTICENYLSPTVQPTTVLSTTNIPSVMPSVMPTELSSNRTIYTSGLTITSDDDEKCQDRTIKCNSGVDCVISLSSGAKCSSFILDGSDALSLKISAGPNTMRDRSCKIICPNGGTCDMSAGYFAFYGGYMDGNYAKRVYITDYSTWAFSHATLNMTTAEYFLANVTQGDGFRDTKIYCPNTLDNNNPNCVIKAITSYAAASSTIYAKYGFQSTQLIANSGYYFYWSGLPSYMHCGNNYNKYCQIEATSNPQCDTSTGDGDWCNLIPITTNIPSAIPTVSPTKVPSNLPSLVPSSTPTPAPFMVQTTSSIIMDVMNTTSELNVESTETLDSIDSDSGSEESQTTNDKKDSNSNGNVMGTGLMIAIIVLGVFICILISVIGWKMFTRYKLKKQFAFQQVGKEILDTGNVDIDV